MRNTISFGFSKDEGKLAENFVGSYLKREEKEVFYWKNKREVDFIVKEKDRLFAINVSCGQKIEKREIESLLEFKKEYKKTKELILITKDFEKRESGIKFIPLWKWLLKEIKN